MPTPLEKQKAEIVALLKDSEVSYLKVVVNPKEPNIDIVAVHGLNPWPSKAGSFGVNTWAGGDSDDPNHDDFKRLWLKEFLPDNFPHARVMIFGYNSNIAWSTSTSGVAGAADDLLARLKFQRRDVTDRPVLFLCHSLGGIVVKLAVSKARSSPQYDDLYLSIRSIAFFATPHRGGLHAKLAQILSSGIRHGSRATRSSIMETLRPDSHIAPEVQRFFEDCLSDKRIHICSFYEAKPMFPLTELIVDQNSAIIGLGFPQEVLYRVQESNHSSICKFKTKDQTYDVVMSYLADLVDHALSDDDAQSLDSNSLSRPFSRNDLFPKTEDSRRSSDHLNVLTERHRSLSPFGRREELRDDGPWSTLPDFGISKFIGRGDILHSIQELLHQETSSQVRVALHGLGGVGKTQIALKVVEQYQQSRPSDSVYWVRAANFDVFKESLEKIAVACDLLDTEYNQAIMLKAVQQHLLNKRNGKWLIIVDNADNFDSVENPSRSRSKATSSSGNLRRVPMTAMIPRCPHGSILFTTNSKIVANQLVTPDGHVLEITPMSSEESQKLLQRQLSENSTTNGGPPSYESIPSTEELEVLANHLGNLPLAIAQAAAYMRQRTLSPAAYLKLIEADESSLTDLLQHDFQGYDTDRDFSKAIAATWNVAFSAIEADSTSAIELLSFLSFLEPQNIPKTLLKVLQPDERELTANSLGTVQAYGLVSYDSIRETCGMHRLVQLAMRNCLKDKDILESSATRALAILDKAFPDKTSPRPDRRNPTEADKHAALLPHALQVLKNVFTNTDENNISASSLASKLSNCYLHLGNYSEALKFSETAKSYMKQVAKPPRKLALSNQATEVMALRESDRLEEAVELANTTYLGYKKELGPASAETVNIRLVQSLIYQDMGRYKDSLAIIKDCIKALEKGKKGDDWQLSMAKVRLGRILFYLGDCKESERILREVLNGVSQKLGANNIETFAIRNRMGFAILALGRPAECEKMCDDTWEAQKLALGDQHPEVLKTLDLKATAMRENGKYDTALRYHRRIYRKAYDVLGSDHRYTKLAATSLADCLSVPSNPNGTPSPASLEEAANLYNQLLASSSSLKTKSYRLHPEFLRNQSNLANVLHLQGKVIEAESLQREAYKNLKAALGKEHPFTLDAREYLARCLKDSGRDKEAAKCVGKVVERREKVLGWEHPATMRGARLMLEIGADEKGVKVRRVRERLAGVGLDVGVGGGVDGIGVDDSEDESEEDEDGEVPRMPERKAPLPPGAGDRKGYGDGIGRDEKRRQ